MWQKIEYINSTAKSWKGVSTKEFKNKRKTTKKPQKNKQTNKQTNKTRRKNFSVYPKFK